MDQKSWLKILRISDRPPLFQNSGQFGVGVDQKSWDSGSKFSGFLIDSPLISRPIWPEGESISFNYPDILRSKAGKMFGFDTVTARISLYKK